MNGILKKAFAVVLTLSLFFVMTTRTCRADWDEFYSEWLIPVAVGGKIPTVLAGKSWDPVGSFTITSLKTPEEFRPWLAKMDFPVDVLRSVMRECETWHGTPVNSLAIDLSGGIHMRSTPDFSSSGNIVFTVHGDETVYVYFEVTNHYGHKWYFGVTDSGVEGFLAAGRILLVR